MDKEARTEALSSAPVNRFDARIKAEGIPPVAVTNIDILQLNITRKCNLACKHCHVQAGPNRIELMEKTLLEKALELAASGGISTIDLTGGAPETHPELEWFLKEAAKLKKRLIVRTNLVILNSEPYNRFFDIYKEADVELCASFPDYNEGPTARQRGKGVFQSSIEVIRILNRIGYAHPGSSLMLDLVHNPSGAYLPGGQDALEHEYRTRLFDRYGILFNRLFCITNMPVGRYLEFLKKSGNFDDYMSELACAFNPYAVENLMCKNTLSVDYNGKLYNCDFNQVLELPIAFNRKENLFDLQPEDLTGGEVVTGNHCYGCTAGAGSSCQGTIV